MSIAFSHGGFKLHVHAICAKQANAVASDIHFFEKIAAEIACIESMYVWKYGYASTRDRAQAWSREQLINTAQKENPVFHHAIKGIMFYDETSFVSIDIVWGLN
jgi:hypothetical protein